MNMNIMPVTSHKALVDNVIAAKGKFTKGVQIAAVQSIGHFLATGDTSFMSKLLNTFSENTLGAKSFVAYMETYGGVEYVGKKKDKAAKFAQHDETRADLPALGDIDAIVEYMTQIYCVDWAGFKPEKVVSIFDVQAAVDTLIKKAMREVEAGHEVKNAGLVQVLNLAVAQYHAAAFDAS